MKMNNSLFRHTLMGLLVIISLLSLGACNKDEAIKWVDLRYKTADSYMLTASDPQPITIQVKSTDPWIVYSNHKDWCSISPDNGVPETTFDVTIIYTDNTELDDRIDTITIKSDYWIGKEIKVTQKGIAYLDLEVAQDILIGKEDNSTYTFKVKTNQKWTAAVTEGKEWLSITKGVSGELDGEVTLMCTGNKGEKRYGKITIYDRHGGIAAEVACTQDGAQLDPETMALRADHTQQQIVLPVVANTEWTVTKDDDDMSWYSFEQTEFNGTQNLVIILDENTRTTVRKATFTLSTKQVEGTIPAIRNIVLKQANNPVVEHHRFDDPANWPVKNGTISFANGEITCTAGRVTRDGFAPGYYSFHIKSMTADAHSALFFTYTPYAPYDALEIRWHLNMAAGKTNYSTSPWTPVIDRNKSFDKSLGSYTLGLNLERSEKPGLMKIKWYLDGVLMDSYDNTQDDRVFPYGSNALVYLGSSAGTVVYDWWEYTAPIEWGDE